MPTDAEPTGPLSGLRVLELGNFIAGPFAGQLLGDYGAEVIKIETPGEGDPMRTWGLTRDGQGLWWPAIARNKRSVAVDLRDEAGRDLVRRLADRVDVVLENFRPGRLDGWGLGYDRLRRSNPGLIVVHVSGFGQTGPRSSDAGFGSIGEAMGGIRATTGDPDRPPARCGISLGDALAGLFAVVGTLAAVTERSRSGSGQEVDVAIYEAVAALMESTLADFEVGGVTRTRTGSVLPGVAPSNAYRTAEGSDVLIAANADSVFARLGSAMGRPELATDPRFVDHQSRGRNMVELDALIATWAGGLGADALLALLSEHGVPAGRVYTPADMVADPHFRAREMVVRAASRAGYDVPMPGVVPRFSRTPGRIDDVGPALGEHTRQVLAELAGVDDIEWSALASAGIVA
ncbi:MAG: CoA transferase [Acidimicrobiales bacterium]|jgi:formyl-CoA transferase/succinyl-CoA--D-citramalate CoA-transferase